ncbi:hypothetical protein ANRL1_02418 [Anaerolineae bacterium]|nr:hypothetical protein ANRL1_02418 [Anaerolineae bacterium]
MLHSKRNSILFCAIVFSFILLLPACAPSTPASSTPTSTPLSTATMTSTSAPTATPTLTATPTITPTPTPTATPTLAATGQTQDAQAAILALAQKQGLKDVTAITAWNNEKDPQNSRVVAFLQSTKDKNQYWIPVIDGATLVEIRMPQDAQDRTWDFQFNQLTYTAATGTKFYWGEDGGWLNKPGVKFVKTNQALLSNPEAYQKAIDEAVDALIIDIGGHNTINIDYSSINFATRKQNDKYVTSLSLQGGKDVDTKTFIKQALKLNAKYYIDSINDLPPYMRNKIKLVDYDILAVLRGLKHLQLDSSSDLSESIPNSLFGIQKAAYWPFNPDNEIYATAGDTLNINFPMLYTFIDINGNEALVLSSQ